MLITDKIPDRPNSASGAAVKLEAYESLGQDEQEYIANLSFEVKLILEKEGAQSANEHIANKIPSEGDDSYDPNTFKMALYHLLDSKTRSQLKGSK